MYKTHGFERFKIWIHHVFDPLLDIAHNAYYAFFNKSNTNPVVSSSNKVAHPGMLSFLHPPSELLHTIHTMPIYQCASAFSLNCLLTRASRPCSC
ncbi:hypothetical protein M422DRAFT_29839 [Sphaerobolus stellatus SS14]|uniref:Uncharacterized protein n=1 Tax=Sphaerobolus stellatus (strain SS14) TaxID=990650 RepID=A0A0C9W2C5_SPHS4|nr:hypothetical protein M422DRAFT_29839 [Sphaerobolus stellatus SS14]